MASVTSTMNVIHPSSVFMSTLALLATGLLPAPALGDVPIDETAVLSTSTDGETCTIADEVTLIDVDGTTKTLEAAITEATQLLSQCSVGVKTIELRLTSNGPHVLPSTIKANGRIVITSALSDDNYATINQEGNTAVTVHSPLALRHIRWVGNYRGFIATNDFIVEDSLIEYGNAGAPDDRNRQLVWASPSVPGGESQPKKQEVLIQNSSFTDIGIAVVKGVDRLHVTKNTAKLTGQPFHLIGITDDEFAETKSTIYENTFSATDHHYPSLITVNDRYADIRFNKFSVDFNSNLSNKIEVGVISIINDTLLNGGFEYVGISLNSFVGGPAVEHVVSEGVSPSKPNAVVVARNDLSQSAGMLFRSSDAAHVPAINAACNFWGTLQRDKVMATGLERVLATADLANGACVDADTQDRNQPKPPTPHQPAPPPAPVPSPDPEPVPSPSPMDDPVIPREISEDATTKVPIDHSGLRIAGLTRYETAVEVAKHSFAAPNADNTVIVARGDVAADSVSAAPLAKALQAPILLTPTNQVHPATMAEVKRLAGRGGEVIVMGGEAAISEPVVQAIGALGIPVSRISGQNRAQTAVRTAELLAEKGKLDKVYVADGQDWQSALITGPVAAKTDGVTLLTNGTALAPETSAFLARHPNLPVTAIGNVAAGTKVTNKTVTGRDATELSLKVAREFFGTTDHIGIATSADFADALIGGGHIGQEGGALVLTNGRNATRINAYLKTQPSITKLYVYGGAERIAVASELNR